MFRALVIVLLAATSFAQRTIDEIDAETFLSRLQRVQGGIS